MSCFVDDHIHLLLSKIIKSVGESMMSDARLPVGTVPYFLTSIKETVRSTPNKTYQFPGMLYHGQMARSVGIFMREGGTNLSLKEFHY